MSLDFINGAQELGLSRLHATPSPPCWLGAISRLRHELDGFMETNHGEAFCAALTVEQQKALAFELVMHLQRPTPTYFSFPHTPYLIAPHGGSQPES